MTLVTGDSGYPKVMGAARHPDLPVFSLWIEDGRVLARLDPDAPSLTLGAFAKALTAMLEPGRRYSLTIALHDTVPGGP